MMRTSLAFLIFAVLLATAQLPIWGSAPALSPRKR